MTKKMLKYFLSVCCCVVVCLTVLATHAYASDDISCPEQPKQFTESGKQNITLGVGKIKNLGLAELGVKLEKQQQETFSKLKEGDKIYQEQMFWATYCSAIKADKSLSSRTRLQLLETYIANSRKIEPKANQTSKRKSKNDKSNFVEKTSLMATEPANLQIRISRDYFAPVSFVSDFSGLKAVLKFHILLSNISSQQFSIINWQAWEQIPTENYPNAGRMFQPKLVVSDNQEKNFDFPLDLSAGSTKKLSLLAPYDIPGEIWAILESRIDKSKSYAYEDIDHLLHGSPFRGLGQLRIHRVENINTPLPGTQVLRTVRVSIFSALLLNLSLQTISASAPNLNCKQLASHSN